MFSEILRRYDTLIGELGSRSIQESIETFIIINCDRKKRQKELSTENEFSAYKRAQQLVKEFLASDDESDFLGKTEEIRSETLAEYAGSLIIVANTGMVFSTTKNHNLYC